MSRLITKEEVKKHNNEKSVWMIIHNEVYDVTKFLDEHPGGPESLLDYAGKDGTQGFEDVGHSADARELMIKFKIGKLPPEEQTNPVCGSGCEERECTVCQASRKPPSPKTCRPPPTPRVEKRVQTIVVPRERRPRGPPCGSNNTWKWALLALAGAIIIGVAMKKYMT